MASTGKGKGKAARAAEAEEGEDNPPVPAGPLENIFIRLDAAEIARASVACTSFRGVITDPAFRRRFGRLHHPPPLVGFLESELPAALYRRALRPRSIHHDSTPAARAVARAADFSCAFLPDPGSWRIRDASSGRLLLSSCAATDFSDLMVCDPLHRTFVRVPPVPDHLTAGTQRPGSCLIPFLVPLPVPLPAGDQKEKQKEPQLQVVWMLQRLHTIIAFVFSSSTWEWRLTPTLWRWRREYPLPLSYRLYAHGCFYWTSCHFRSHSALKLDTCKMKISTIQLPTVTKPLGKTNFIVEASECDLGALVLDNQSLDLYCRAREEGNGDSAAADWLRSRTVPLPDDSLLHYSIIGAADGYLLLQAYPKLYFARPQTRYFSVKLKTLVFEELHVSLNRQLVFAHIYTNFPPLLSLPSVYNEQKSGPDLGMTGEASAT